MSVESLTVVMRNIVVTARLQRATNLPFSNIHCTVFRCKENDFDNTIGVGVKVKDSRGRKTLELPDGPAVEQEETEAIDLYDLRWEFEWQAKAIDKCIQRLADRINRLTHEEKEPLR